MVMGFQPAAARRTHPPQAHMVQYYRNPRVEHAIAGLPTQPARSSPLLVHCPGWDSVSWVQLKGWEFASERVAMALAACIELGCRA